ncbi:hypothetical protein ACFWB1_30955 [Streptomyces goshikiensis]|uniref:hypothetical protein n=1 Tax=Streptomyces goshikiensis TaxID=1942 RepID=UPI003680FF69
MKNNKGLGRFVTARTVSILGDRLAETVLPIVILLATGDALLAGLVTAANVAPTFLLSLPIGHWVDLRERQHEAMLAFPPCPPSAGGGGSRP